MFVSGCPLRFFMESGDFAVRIQTLFAIGSEIPAQLIAILKRLFQLGIHLEDLSIADRLDGEGL